MEMRAAVTSAGERALAADVDPVGSLDVAPHLAEHDDFARHDVGGHLAVAANGHAVTGQVDGALDLAVDVKGFGARELSLDDEGLADGGLIAGRSDRGRTGWGNGTGGGCSLERGRGWGGRARRLRGSGGWCFRADSASTWAGVPFLLQSAWGLLRPHGILAAKGVWRPGICQDLR